MRSITARGRELAEDGKKRRKAMLEKMLNELREEKKDMIARREDMKAQYKLMNDDDPQKGHIWLKIRKIEDDLKTEYFKLVEDQEVDRPSVGKPKAPVVNKEYNEEKKEQQIKDEETKKKRQK